MEKNIAAFLDDSAYSVRVRIDGTGHEYTYVTNIVGLEVGDAVVVPVIGQTRTARLKFDSINTTNLGVDKYDAKVATVSQVDPEVNVPTDSDLEYKWVIAKIDFNPWLATMERNNQIVDAVTDAYKHNLRRSFSERILGEMQDGPKNQLLALLGKKRETRAWNPTDYETWLRYTNSPDSPKSMMAYQDYVKSIYDEDKAND